MGHQRLSRSAAFASVEVPSADPRPLPPSGAVPPGAITGIDRHARVTYVNSAFEGIFGYWADELSRLPPYDRGSARELVPGDGRERVAKGRTGGDTELGKGPVEVTADSPGWQEQPLREPQRRGRCEPRPGRGR
jgi:PAS domain-containing protein